MSVIHIGCRRLGRHYRSAPDEHVDGPIEVETDFLLPSPEPGVLNGIVLESEVLELPSQIWSDADLGHDSSSVEFGSYWYVTTS